MQEPGRPESGQHVAVKAVGRAVHLVVFALRHAAESGVPLERLVELTGWDGSSSTKRSPGLRTERRRAVGTGRLDPSVARRGRHRCGHAPAGLRSESSPTSARRGRRIGDLADARRLDGSGDPGASARSRSVNEG